MPTQIAKILSFFSGDILFLVVVCVIFLGYVVYFGRNQAVSLILAFYPALFFYKMFPYVNKLIVLHGEKLITLNQICIFLVLLMVLNFVIDKYVFSSSELGGSFGIVYNLLLSFAMLVLVLVFSYTTVSIDPLYNLSSTIDNLFAGNNPFWWSLVPFLVLAFI